MMFEETIALRGKMTCDADLGRRSWFRTGGRAEYVFEPIDMEDLALFLHHCPENVPLHVMGLGSNMLVRDGGVRGVVVIPHFEELYCDANRIEAGVGVAARKIADEALAQKLSGFEFMRGIPGSVGGCLAMNAGAYGSEIAEVFVEAVALNRQGEKQILTKEDMGFAYRKALTGVIFTHAVFQGSASNTKTIQTKMDKIIAERRATQPPGARTGGSTFKNPSPQLSNKKAWELIASSDCRTFSEGDAVVCEKHCNFLVNRGEASATDIEKLGERIRAQVKEKKGISLEWEIQRIGERES